ncbi:glycoside hydrolase family 127 protein [Oerskovia merdavium]|uniref:Glycoside hydrolase family 127 protein n=1 Tax=Oerskovia merdavium TaxID=2762227 RepID=A0ABR8TX55_9CELL|nr:beta-L-arabinofuranosidase domain-containing protein [Oerskovia merdavium]MBD7980347.1 glycoside hydrolase family 127 protein [Oerskovia merdavium]
MTTTTSRSTGGRPVVPVSSVLRPLGLDEVRITGGFWADRQETNRVATLTHIEHWLEKEGWLGNFDAAVEGRLPAARRGREFSDSEVYKLLEAMAWELGRRPDDELDARFDAIVRRVAAVQEPDGYLSTMFGRPGQGARYSDLEWGHELYCYGHLIQAAVARARTGGDQLLVEVARRAADHVCATFGHQGNQGICGHAEIEVALAELSRVTGERRYLDQAALFVERHGNGTLRDIEFGRSYFQDDQPVREATVFRGHAVRANYLAAGALDVAADAGDHDLLRAVATQWENTVARRTYITGGQGSHHQDEAFGEDFVLPPDRAYAETCAGIGSIMTSWRLLLATGEARYADLVERTLFNVVATSPAHDGTSFYYTNTLHQRVPGVVPPVDVASARASSSLRAPWFEVSCCPPNVARTFASLATYFATVDEDGLQVHQYADAEIRTALPDGTPVEVDVHTDFPDSGAVTFRVLRDTGRELSLRVRVPAWSASARLSSGGETWSVEPGTAEVRRAFRAGDEVLLELDVSPRVVTADDRIDAVRGCVAVERGPEVLCAESLDQAVDDVAALVVDPSSPLREQGGHVVATGWRSAPVDAAWPYPESPGAAPGGTGDGPGRADDPFDVVLTPYHDWANRGPSTMRIWLPTA